MPEEGTTRRTTLMTDIFETTIYVGGLRRSVTEERLGQLFSEFGTIISVKIPRTGNDFGFVQFLYADSAKAAFRMHGYKDADSSSRLCIRPYTGHRPRYQRICLPPSSQQSPPSSIDPRARAESTWYGPTIRRRWQISPLRRTPSPIMRKRRREDVKRRPSVDEPKEQHFNIRARGRTLIFDRVRFDDLDAPKIGKFSNKTGSPKGKETGQLDHFNIRARGKTMMSRWVSFVDLDAPKMGKFSDKEKEAGQVHNLNLRARGSTMMSSRVRFDDLDAPKMGKFSNIERGSAGQMQHFNIRARGKTMMSSRIRFDDLDAPKKGSPKEKETGQVQHANNIRARGKTMMSSRVRFDDLDAPKMAKFSNKEGEAGQMKHLNLRARGRTMMSSRVRFDDVENPGHHRKLSNSPIHKKGRPSTDQGEEKHFNIRARSKTTFPGGFVSKRENENEEKENRSDIPPPHHHSRCSIPPSVKEEANAEDRRPAEGSKKGWLYLPKTCQWLAPPPRLNWPPSEKLSEVQRLANYFKANRQQLTIGDRALLMWDLQK